MTIPRWLLAIFTLCLYLPALSAGQLQFVSTESDPDAFIQNSVNVINGDYCESATDLVITGPDALVLQRFYSTKDIITGVQAGGWRMLPQRFLVVGKDASGKSCTVGKDRFEWTIAFTGERSGGILPYSGWRNTNGSTKDPLKIDILNNAVGLVNTYAQEINGQTNHQNNLLQSHTYDSLDNRIQTNNDELVYNALNQLISHANTECSYDAQGNLLRKVLDGEETRFESNILSQLASIEKADQTALIFSYDPFGRLLVEKHLDVKGKNKKTLTTTRNLYLGYQEIGTLSSIGTIESLKIPGLHGDELSPISVAFEIKGETYVPIHDIAGNVVRLIDPQNRQVIESYEYTAFGQVSIFNAEGEQEDTSIVGNPWQFAEKRIDDKSGLILFGLRFYDPAIGRWISQDPAGGLDGPNSYAYLHNNPLNHLDRFGLATESNSDKFDGYMYGEVESHCYCEKHRTCKRGGDIGKTAGSHLPQITYLKDFEQMYPDYESSKTFDLSANGFPNLPNDLGVGFINGIWNDAKGSRESAEYLSKLAGGYNIHAVFNATHGTCADLKECKKGLNYIATEPVRQLHKMWNSFFEKSSANSKFLMICHSQGAIHVRNALLDYPPELRERILVVAIAPAAYIYQETCAKVIHYRAEWWRDFVPRFDKAGARREKHSIITLAFDSKASAFDHEFMSPTYQERLRWHITNYIQTQGKML